MKTFREEWEPRSARGHQLLGERPGTASPLDPLEGAQSC